MAINEISAFELVSSLKDKNNVLIIDCRSFLVFNKGHISGAINVRCNSIMRRRSKGLFALENAITNTEKKTDFLSGNYCSVVVYDDQGGNLCENENVSIKCKRTAAMVNDVLQLNAPESTNVCYLTCSFKEFACSYPKHCEGHTRTSLPVLPLSTATPNSTQTPSTAVFTPVYDQGAAVEILPFLYLGSGFHASQKSQLQSLGITAVLNASSTCPNHFLGDFTYKRIPVEDNSQADISVWFNDAFSYINDIKAAGGKVLVHCHAGVSRSATICLAYLIACHSVSLSDAFRYVKHRRNVISPNFNFMGQLLKLENDMAAQKGIKTEAKSAFDFSLPRVEEMEVQDENFGKEANKPAVAHARCFLNPLAQIDNHLESECHPKGCLTAPPRLKEFNFFREQRLSCSQQNSRVSAHIRRHSRTLTLST